MGDMVTPDARSISEAVYAIWYGAYGQAGAIEVNDRHAALTRYCMKWP
jgi:hypothetical protein